MRPICLILSVTCAVLVMVCATGCDYVENPRVLMPGEPGVAETRSVELQRSQFDDVPVPEGFEFVTRGNRSFSYARGGVRVGRFVYWGRRDVAEVAGFFRRTMGLRAYGWELRAENTSGDGADFEFQKDQTGCHVTISRERGGTYVRIDLAGPA